MAALKVQNTAGTLGLVGPAVVDASQPKEIQTTPPSAQDVFSQLMEAGSSLPPPTPEEVTHAHLVLLASLEAKRNKRGEKPSPDEIAKRLKRFAWTPTKEDAERLEKAVEAAKNLSKNENTTISFLATTPAVDIKNAPDTAMYAELIKNIDNSKTSISAALYGVHMVPEVIEALRRAIARGVDVKIVVDQNGDGSFTYQGTDDLLEEFGSKVVRVENSEQNSIMHHKFWVFDDKKVWTGSTNIDASAVRKGHNNEISLVIESKNLAKVFNVEHAQMWVGRFHTNKEKLIPCELPISKNGIQISAYFSPEDNALPEAIIPAIDKAEKSIRLLQFHLSDQDVTKALIKAKRRGVDVQVIVDATGAENEYTRRNMEALRDAGVQVKVENWGGKQHVKGGVIDAEIPEKAVVVEGSMNWTGAGAAKNDENCLVIRGDANLAKSVADDFDAKNKSLPRYLLYSLPASEGFNSIATLIDGKDNSHSGNPDRLAIVDTYFRALDEIWNGCSSMNRIEGTQAARDAYNEGMAVLLQEIQRVRKVYEDPEAPAPEYFQKQVALIENDMATRLDAGMLSYDRDELDRAIKTASAEEIDALWDKRVAVQKQLDSLFIRRLLKRSRSLSLSASLAYHLVDITKSESGTTEAASAAE